MRLLIVLLVLICFTAIVSCQPKRVSVPTTVVQTAQEAEDLARAGAMVYGGWASIIAPSGSMEPTLSGGDWIVVKPTTFNEVKKGWMAVYQARWLPPTANLVCHWVADKSGDEFIMDGEANKHYEKGSQKMGVAEYRGRVVAIYKVQK